MASSMAWYRGGTTTAGDEFFENQTAGWSLWTFSASEEQDTTGAYSDRHEEEGAAPLEEEPGFTQPTEEIFLSQFSDEEVRRMDDAPFEPLDMFPDSMHRLLSYENMLTGVLTGSEDGDRDGVDAMDTCGFPLFSHDLQTGEQGIQLADPASEEDKAGLSVTKRSRSRFIADADSAPGFEALVLEELEDVVFQLTKRTRMCYRDAFYRLAESSKANCSTADRAAQVGSTQSFHGTASRSSTTPGCHERETNPIDRTVMVFTMKPPQLHGKGNCFSDDHLDHEAQSTTTT
jgi:hypothetical protein